jgi:hypothetical protein
MGAATARVVAEHFHIVVEARLAGGGVLRRHYPARKQIPVASIVAKFGFTQHLADSGCGFQISNVTRV